MNRTALALFSGGLDSMLACRLIMAQQIRVVAVKFVTPFFGYDLLAGPAAYQADILRRYGIEVHLREVSRPYLAMLANPAHGYGKNFNPCVDCKILLMAAARELMAEFGASFLISGEVLGQRPMSQRMDTLRLIERDSGCRDLLLRPLCAKHLPPTLAEREGWVDREQLLAFRGRNRTPQIQLAVGFGITDFPSPAGGCLLTDPNLAARFRRLYAEKSVVVPGDVRILLCGRIFRLPGGSWLALGRDQQENEKLAARRDPDNWQLKLRDLMGPLGMLRFSGAPADLQAAAGLLARFGRRPDPPDQPTLVEAEKGGEIVTITAAPLADQEFAAWRC